MSMLSVTENKLKQSTKTTKIVYHQQKQLSVLIGVGLAVLLLLIWQGQKLALAQSKTTQSVVFADLGEAALKKGNYKEAYQNLKKGWEIEPTQQLQQAILEFPNSQLKFLHFENNYPITFATFSLDGKTFVSGSASGELNLWTLDGQLINQYYHNAPIIKAGFSHDNKWLYSLGKDHEVNIWQSHHKAVFNFPDKTEVFGIDFRSDGKEMLTGVHDKTIKRWKLDPKDPYAKPKILRHKTFLSQAVYLPKSKDIISTTIDGYLYFWKNGEALDSVVDIHKGNVTHLEVIDTLIITASLDSTVKGWSSASYRLLFDVSLSSGVLKANYLKNNGKLLVLEKNSKVAKLLNKNGKIMATFKHPMVINNVFYHETLDAVVTSDVGGTIKVWSLKGKEKQRLFYQAFDNQLFLNNTFHLLSVGHDNNACLWSLEKPVLESDSVLTASEVLKFYDFLENKADHQFFVEE